MKKDEIKIGETYTAKVSDKVVPVRIDKANPRGGWDATNMRTNRPVRIKSAQRLRGRATVPKDNDKPAPKQPVKKKLTAAERRARVNQATAKADKPAAATKKADAPKEKKLSLIDAAVQILGNAKEPMGTKQMVEKITEQNLWSPRSGGKTPHATLYSAILRELQKKGKDARFTKVERGRFTLAKGA
jgi:HB1, ASXL, restriction endonuclease HTH domain